MKLPAFIHRNAVTLFASLLLTTGTHLCASSSTDSEYEKVVAGRAQKIVAAISLPDAGHADRVASIIAGQYVALRAIHDVRDARLAAIKAGGEADPAAAKKLVADEAAARLYELHAAYLAHLAVELTPEQVDQVKDGMTYGVLPNTWRVYQEMLPDLTDEQKRQVLAWLIEAREHAMDGSTSEEKHGWFGKYKGRINNYLSKAGYDMKKAEKEMFERKKR